MNPDIIKQLRKELDCPYGCQRCHEALDHLNKASMEYLGVKFTEAPCLLEIFEELERLDRALEAETIKSEMFLAEMRRMLRG